MTTDFRALCVELTDCLEKADWPHRYKQVFQFWVDVARGALTEPDGPAVPDGREPASVTEQSIRNLLISLTSHMAYMQGQLEAHHEYDDWEDFYWYRESVKLREKAIAALAKLEVA